VLLLQYGKAKKRLSIAGSICYVYGDGSKRAGVDYKRLIGFVLHFFVFYRKIGIDGSRHRLTLAGPLEPASWRSEGSSISACHLKRGHYFL
jgi:hypothetical protein